MGYLTADELLAGSAVTHAVEIPAELLPPRAGSNGDGAQPGRVRMRPLTVRDIQRVTKAARDDDALLSVLMLKEALVEPELSFEQLNELPAGVARILLHELNRVSGLSVDVHLDPLAETALASGRSEGAGPESRDPDTLEVGEWVRPGTPGPGFGNARGGGSSLETRTSLTAGLMGSGGDPLTAGPVGAPSIPSPSALDPKARRPDPVLHLEPIDRVGRRARHRSEASDRPGPLL